MAKAIVTLNAEIHYRDDLPGHQALPKERLDEVLAYLGGYAELNGASLIVIRHSAFYEPAVQPVSETPGAVVDPFTESEGSAQ